MKRKFVLGVIAILCLATCFLSASLFKITEEDEAMYDAYRKQTFRNNSTTATSIIQRVENEIDPPISSSNQPVPPGLPNQVSWLEVLDAVHKAWGGAGAYYHQATHEMLLWGETVRVNWDCSGYIGYCLYKYGRVTQNGIANSCATIPIHSCTGWASNNECSHYRDASVYNGVKYVPGPDFDVTRDLRPGDILWYSGHVEVFYEYNGNAGNSKPRVYNWGGTYSSSGRYTDNNGNLISASEIANAVSYSGSGHTLSSIKAVWRLN